MTKRRAYEQDDASADGDMANCLPSGGDRRPVEAGVVDLEVDKALVMDVDNECQVLVKAMDITDA